MLAVLALSEYPVPVRMPLALCFAFACGAFVGLLCSPLAVVLLRRRDLNRVRVFVVWSAAPAVIFTARLEPDPYTPFPLMFFSGATFVLAIVAAYLLLPRIWHNDMLCRRCGYDIRASKEFDRCPECGTTIGTVHIKSIPRSPTRGNLLPTFVTQRPTLPILTVIFLAIVFAAFQHASRFMTGNAIVVGCKSASAKGETLSLASATSFEWDTVHILSSALPRPKHIGLDSPNLGNVLRQTQRLRADQRDPIRSTKEGVSLRRVAHQQDQIHACVAAWTLSRNGGFQSLEGTRKPMASRPSQTFR